jgi:Na+/melibiose symporter-like transporter
VSGQTASATTQPLALRRALTYALAQFPISALGVALLVYLPPHLTRELGVPLVVVGTSWWAVRLLDVGVDPFLGLLMDRTRSRLGRYRPWVLSGIPIMMTGAYMLFMAPAGIGWTYLVPWLLVLYLAMSIFTLGVPAWGATLASSYNERARVYGVLTAVGLASTVAMLLLPVAGATLHKSDAWAVHAMGWGIVAMTPVMVGLSAWLTPERIPKDAGAHGSVRLSDYVALARKPDLLRCWAAQVCITLGPGWMTALYIYFTRDVMRFQGGSNSILLLFYIAGGLAGAPLMAHLATRIGKHRALMVAAACYSLGLCTVLLPPKGMWWWAIPTNLWCGFMGGSFEMLIRSLLADVADEVRLEGKDQLSMVFAVTAAVAKLATAFSLIITYPLLQVLGYVPALKASNTPGALHALSAMFMGGPIVFVMAAAACMRGWRMTADRHAQVRAELDARDAALAALGEAEPLVESAFASSDAAAE